MKITPKERELITVMVLLAVVAVFYAFSIRREITNALVIEQQVAEYEESIKPFLDLAVNAKSFTIYNMDKKEFVYKNNAEMTMPLASLAKVMSAVVIMEHVPADYVFQISKEALSESGDNKLLVDEKWKRDELLKFALVESSNDALWQMATEAGKLIDPASTDPMSVFVTAMNAKADTLRLMSFDFKNASGLDLPEGQSGGSGSGRDMVRLFTYALDMYPDIFAPTKETQPIFRSLDVEHVAKNTNPFVNEIPGLIASKTGFTNIAGGNLIVALHDKKGARLAVVVMGSTFDERFSDVKAISLPLQNPQPGF